jgi:hypothetical protein
MFELASYDAAAGCTCPSRIRWQDESDENVSLTWCKHCVTLDTQAGPQGVSVSR